MMMAKGNGRGRRQKRGYEEEGRVTGSIKEMGNEGKGRRARGDTGRQTVWLW